MFIKRDCTVRAIETQSALPISSSISQGLYLSSSKDALPYFNHWVGMDFDYLHSLCTSLMESLVDRTPDHHNEVGSPIFDLAAKRRPVGIVK